MDANEGSTIRLSRDEVMELCKPGEGSNTYIWLLLGSESFDCHYYCRPTALSARWQKGSTVAKRDGCEEVKSLRREIQHKEAHTLADLL